MVYIVGPLCVRDGFSAADLALLQWLELAETMAD